MNDKKTTYTSRVQRIGIEMEKRNDWAKALTIKQPTTPEVKPPRTEVRTTYGPPEVYQRRFGYRQRSRSVGVRRPELKFTRTFNDEKRTYTDSSPVATGNLQFQQSTRRHEHGTTGSNWHVPTYSQRGRGVTTVLSSGASLVDPGGEAHPAIPSTLTTNHGREVK